MRRTRARASGRQGHGDAEMRASMASRGRRSGAARRAAVAARARPPGRATSHSRATPTRDGPGHWDGGVRACGRAARHLDDLEAWEHLELFEEAHEAERAEEAQEREERDRAARAVALGALGEGGLLREQNLPLHRGQDVDREGAGVVDVALGDLLPVEDELVVAVAVRRAEVDDDVDVEEEVEHEVDLAVQLGRPRHLENLQGQPDDVVDDERANDGEPKEAELGLGQDEPRRARLPLLELLLVLHLLLQRVEHGPGHGRAPVAHGHALTLVRRAVARRAVPLVDAEPHARARRPPVGGGLGAGPEEGETLPAVCTLRSPLSGRNPGQELDTLRSPPMVWPARCGHVPPILPVGGRTAEGARGLIGGFRRRG